MSSSECDKDYATRVQRESDRMDEDDPVAPSNSPQLEYATPNSQSNQVSKAADFTTNTRQQHAGHVDPALNNESTDINNVANIQLSYNINQALDPESWDGNFCAISLHESMEHLASDVKNIKDSLIRMCKFILGKSIEDDKANNIKDLKGVSKAAWEFISSLYEVHWDSLIVDNTKTSFRNKIKSKLSPQIGKTPVNVKDKDIVKPTYVSPLPPPILAKSPKKVIEILKYFKKNLPSAQKKSYTQVSSNLSTSNIAKETLKIKEAFPNLQNKKIKQVQKLISSNNKSKPCINMTTKEPSCKQVIVPMNINNSRKFIKNSSTHIINIKSNVMADFICIEDKGIVISTNNVASPSDLQEIEGYIKNLSYVDADQIKALRLPQFKLYLKIVGILYLSEQSNTCLFSNNVEKIINVTNSKP